MPAIFPNFLKDATIGIFILTAAHCVTLTALHFLSIFSVFELVALVLRLTLLLSGLVSLLSPALFLAPSRNYLPTTTKQTKLTGLKEREIWRWAQQYLSAYLMLATVSHHKLLAITKQAYSCKTGIECTEMNSDAFNCLNI